MRTKVLVFMLVALAAPAFCNRTVVQERFLVSPAWLAASQPKVIILHVAASRGDYDRGHIPGAIYVPLEALIVDREGIANEVPPIADLRGAFQLLGIGNSGRIVIYGDTELSAARAFFTLDYLGHGWRVSLLDGGLARWKSENRPVTQEPAYLPSRMFHVLVQSQALITRQEITELLGLDGGRFAEDIALVDARPLEQFTGEDPGRDIQRAGHIPTAHNICWTENLTHGEVRAFRSAEELARLYQTAGMRPTTMPIVYCRTGMEASLTYFVLRYLGYEPALYDGSFVEWSATEGAPVERSETPRTPIQTIFIGQ